MTAPMPHRVSLQPAFMTRLSQRAPDVMLWAMDPAAQALVVALDIQARTGRQVRAWQLPLASPCPGGRYVT